MSHRLADLLEHDHPLFTYNIGQLERASGDDGIDTRLLAEVDEKAHTIMVRLGLDRTDTTAEELYHAIQALDGATRPTILSDTTYVLASKDGEVVSFNLEDVIENAHHQLDFAHRVTESAKRHLRAEIIRRYAENDRTDNTLVTRLASEAGLMPDRDEGRTPLPKTDTVGRPTLLAIGDIFSDVFIQLREDESKVENDEQGNPWLMVPFGVKPPYESAETVDAVGPSPNAGVSVARLGVDTSLMAWMGSDKVAESTRKYLDREGINHQLIDSAANAKSNTYYVLRRGAERTILVKNEEYDYAWREPATALDWIYLSLISDKSWLLHEDMLRYLDLHPETKLAFQPGTFHFKWGTEKMLPIYQRAEIVVVNREEAVDITGGNHEDVKDLLWRLRELGPKVAVVTDGPNGSYAAFDDRTVTIPNYPDIASPLDRTGAGDAFASTIVAALALGETMETALTWAPINSMNVVQKLGAQAGLQTRAQIEEWLTKAPTDYRVTDI